jgi:hypothetical protein
MTKIVAKIALLGVLAASLTTAVAASAADSCCKPGAPCCQSGSLCCK